MSCGFTRFMRDDEAMPFEALPLETMFVESGGVL
jgi:hypothetical protein